MPRGRKRRRQAHAQKHDNVDDDSGSGTSDSSSSHEEVPQPPKRRRHPKFSDGQIPQIRSVGHFLSNSLVLSIAVSVRGLVAVGGEYGRVLLFEERRENGNNRPDNLYNLLCSLSPHPAEAAWNTRLHGHHHRSRVTQLMFNHAGTTLVSNTGGCQQQTLAWRVHLGAQGQLAELGNQRTMSVVRKMEFTSDDSVLVMTLGGSTTVLFDTDTWQLQRVIQGGEDGTVLRDSLCLQANWTPDRLLHEKDPRFVVKVAEESACVVVVDSEDSDRVVAGPQPLSGRLTQLSVADDGRRLFVFGRPISRKAVSSGVNVVECV